MSRNKHIVSWVIAALLVGLGIGGVRADAGQDTADAARKDIAKTLGFVPRFFQVMADAAVGGMWAEMKGLQLNPNSALPGKTKELVGLAVAAQVPCRYCISAHTEFAKLNGASEAEIAEAVAVGALARQVSAYANGLPVDDATFQSDLRKMLDAKPSHTASGPIEVIDAASARKDIEQTLGFVPAFLSKIPDTALPGAWRELKELRLSNTVLSGKVKALIALAVASQTPSRMCITAETEISKRNGASERELAEAVGMAAITRNMSTLLNGQQTDERQFNADIAKLVNGAKAAQKLAAKK
jgi:AhpD family alkylhydroperoxidase